MAFIGNNGRHSVLEEEALLFQEQEEKTEKQKWAELNHRQRLCYLKDYYLFKFLICIASAACVGFLVWSAIKPQKEPQLFFAMVHNMMLPEEKNALEQLFTELFITDPMHQEIHIDDSFPTGYESDAKLSTYLAANEIDLIVTNESHFQILAENAIFKDLNTCMSEFTKEHSKYLYWTKGYAEEVPSETSHLSVHAYGMDVSECERIKKVWHQEEKAILGIVTNCRQPENAKIAITQLIFT